MCIRDRTYDAQIFSKQINGYHVSSDVMDERVCGQVNQEDAHVNRPNVTVCGVPEGLIIQTGKPFTFLSLLHIFRYSIVGCGYRV